MSVSLLSSSLGSQPYFSGFFTLRFLHFGPHSCRRLKFNMAASLSANSYNSATMNYNGARYKVLVILDNNKHKHACRVNIRKPDHGFLEFFESLKNYIFYYSILPMNNLCLYQKFKQVWLSTYWFKEGFPDFLGEVVEHIHSLCG